MGPDDVYAAEIPVKTRVIPCYCAGSSEAGKAGFPVSDVIMAIDGKPVRDIQDLVWHLGKIPSGRSMSAMIICCQQESTIKIQLK